MTTMSPPPVPSDLAKALIVAHRQRAFGYPLKRWHFWVGHIRGVGSALDGLPNAIDRSQAAQHIERLIPDNLAGAFTIAMVWGHGYLGYGPYRTAAVLTGSRSPHRKPLSVDIEARLRSSVEIARSDGAVEGYRSLNNRRGHLAGLGPAFFTKWLYFVSARGETNRAEAVPILDRLVMKWLDDHLIHLRTGSTDDYGRYVSILRSWGDAYGLTAAQVEERIFGLIRGDGSVKKQPPN